MKYTFTFIIYAFSICFLQNIAVAKDKVSVNVSVNKSGISVSLSKDNKAKSSNEEKSNSQTSPSFQNTSNQKSLSNISDNNTSNNNDNNDNNDNNSSDTNGNIEDIKKNNKINNWKLNQKEKIANTVKDIKNKGYASKQDFKIIDDELNKKIKQIAKKINFEFDSNDGIQSVEFFNVSESNLEKIVKKTEIIDYIQKTFEVMGIIR